MLLRKPLALAIVLLLAGLAPAAAILGFCARMPCCTHGAVAPVALSTATDDCCNTVTCYEAPSAKLINGASATNAVFTAPAVVPSVAAFRQAHVARAAVVPSPPRGTRNRLALISTLLI